MKRGMCIPALLAGILLVISVAYFLNSQGMLPFQIATGGTVLSISKAQFVSNDATINGPAWLVNFVANDQGQYIQEIGADAKPVQNPLTVKFSVDKQDCVYPFQSTSQSIYLLTVREKDWVTVFWGTYTPQPSLLDPNPKPITKTVDDVCARNFGDENPAYLIAGNKIPGTLILQCVYKYPKAVIGNIGDSAFKFETTVDVFAKGQTYSAKINQNQQSAWLGGDKVQVSWVGHLSSGEQCPTAIAQKISSIYVNNIGWKTVEEQYVNDYKIESASFNSFLSLNPGGGELNLKNRVIQYNNVANLAINANKGMVSAGGTTARVFSYSSNNGSAVLSLNKLIYYPELSLRIKADWLGVAVPVGIPRITPISCESFKTGDAFAGSAEMKIKNVGDSQGSFVYGITCPSNFEQSGVSQTITLRPSEEKTVFIPIVAEATGLEEIKKNCGISVYDKNNPNNRDSASLECSVKPIITCAPQGKTVCEGNVIMKCLGGWIPEKACDIACVVNQTSGLPYCKGEITPNICGNNICESGETVDTCPADCRKPPTPMPWFFIIILGIIGSLVVIYAITKRKK